MRMESHPDEERPRRRWTREEYMRMVDVGLLTKDDRVELIEGEVLARMTERGPHSAATGLAEEALRKAFGPGHWVRVQHPLDLDRFSCPEPALAVVPGGPRDYSTHHPKTALLVVEVADSSLGFDVRRKARLYAQAGIADYWVVDLGGRRVQVHRKPSAEGFRSVTSHTEGEIQPVTEAFPVRVADLLP